MRFTQDNLPQVVQSLPDDIRLVWLEVVNGIPETVDTTTAEKAASAAISEMGYELTDGKWIAAKGAALAGPIVLKQDAQRKVYGPVLIPDEPDKDGETVSAAKIEQVAETFLADYGNVDVMHSLNNVGKVCQSYIAPTDLAFGQTLVPRGSWMLGVKVTDDETWAKVQSGELNGFSVMGVSKSKATKAEAKRVLLGDLGSEWIATHVSLVKGPAVPKAKWLAIKQEADEPAKKGLLAKITKAVAGVMTSGKSGRKYSDKDYSKLQQAHQIIGELLADAQAERAEKSETEVETVSIGTMTPEQVQKMIQDAITAALSPAITSALEPVTKRIEALETSGKSSASSASATDGASGSMEAAGKDGGTKGTEAATKSTEDKVKELIAQVEELSKAVTPATKGLSGQDGGTGDDAAKKSAAATDRDTFGRKIRK